LGAGVCDQTTVVAHNETAPAKISPVVMRISITSKVIAVESPASSF
jgi:hypothetical protein